MGHGALGIGHWALGMGHWAWGIGHWAWRIGRKYDFYICLLNVFISACLLIPVILFAQHANG
jgi:hypothetical protein